ncbi:MAG: TPM domain-containing protein [Candidatus Yanofskybacteria bacterium]|nr:TPM domain-containing protein [Candidatus Yanofskybacteria bacterium]
MKSWARRSTLTITLVVVIMLALVYSSLAHGQELPKPIPNTIVQDFAQVLPHPVRLDLERQLLTYEQQTSIEVTVVTVTSLQGMTTEEYANKLFHQWGIGKKEKDNGILFLIAPNDRKMRIEVGYGLEPDLTDAQSEQIVAQVVPLFAQGNLPKGIRTGVNGILRELGPKQFEARLQERREQAARKTAAEEALGEKAMKIVFSFVGFVVLFGIWVFVNSKLRSRRELKELNEKNIDRLPKLWDRYTLAKSKIDRLMSSTISQLKTMGHTHAWEQFTTANDRFRQSMDKAWDVIRLDEMKGWDSSPKVSASLDNWEMNLCSLESLPGNIEDYFQKFQEAKEQSQELLNTLAHEITDTRELVLQPEYDSSAIKKVDEAMSLFQQTRAQASSSHADWIKLRSQLAWITDTLAEAKKLTKQAIQEAQEAQYQRQIKLEQEDQRRKREEDEQRAYSNDSNNSSSSSSSSSSDSGFTFGGGNSGGGGASGEW